MRKYSLILCAAVIVAVPAGASAQTAPTQEAAPLTLQGAIDMAQQKGPLAEVARNSRDAARLRNDAFNARLLPQLFLSGNAANLNRGINPITLPDGSTQFIGQAQNQSSLQAGFSQAIPLTGGTISISSMISRIDQFATSRTPYDRFYQTSPVVIGLQQDLFKPRNVVWNKRTQSLSASVAFWVDSSISCLRLPATSSILPVAR